MSGFIYLITDWSSKPTRYKVGITKGSVENRLKSLQTGSSGELVLLQTYHSDNYRKIETILHRGYKAYATDGGKEWFELPDERVLDFKKECKTIDNNLKILKENNSFFNQI
tara:strand:+ start:1426 stop:1758 length:333 start_codon:yes stop_codon:yes gene_type:complete